jgi:acyl-CoA thioester hydrolase
VRDEWLAGLLDTATVWEFVLTRVAIDFRRELVQDDDEIVAACRLERIGRSSVTTRETLRVAADGTLAAEAESVLVARDRESGASRPLTDAERAAFERGRSG